MKALQRYGFNASEFATHRSRVQAANLMHLHHRHTGVQRVCRECEVTCKRADQFHVNRRVSTNPSTNIEFSCNRSTKHRASSINLQQYRLTAFFYNRCIISSSYISAPHKQPYCTVVWLLFENFYPRESFREGLCNHRRTFVCLFVCLFVTTITK